MSEPSRDSNPLIGHRVLVSLSNGDSAQGVIQSADAVSGVVLRAGSYVHRNGGQEQPFETYAIGKEHMLTVKMLSREKVGTGSSSPKTRSSRGGSAELVTPAPPVVPAQTARHHRKAQHPQQQTAETLQIHFSKPPHPEDIYAVPDEPPHLQQQPQSLLQNSEAEEGDSSEPTISGSSAKTRGNGKRKKGVRGGGERSALAASVVYDTGNEADESSAGLARSRGSHTSAVDTSFTSRHPPRPLAPTSGDIDDPFDFDGGNSKFDKRAEFERIRSQDQTDPASRLVAHNRNAKHLVKLLPSENVLSVEELEEQQRDLSLGSDAAGTPTAPLSGLSVRGRLPAEPSDQTTSDYGHPPPRQQFQRSAGPPVAPQPDRGRGFVTPSGCLVPEVKLKRFKEALSIADIETGPNAAQRHENAGRGIASFILHTLAHKRQLFPLEGRKRPRIAILCDDCEKSSIALRVGFHLVNHGAHMVAYILRTENHSEAFKTNLRVFSSAGGRIVRELEDLSGTFDLLVDAIADNEIQAALEPKSTVPLAAAVWAASTPFPILSIDAPFGTDHDSGASTTPTPLRPWYIACCGAVRAGCSQTNAEVILVDIGMPPSLWSRAGVDDWDPSTFGFEWVIPLSRA